MNNNEPTNNQNPTNSTPKGSGDDGGRLFTQEEVNRIVSDRLAREREKAAAQAKEADKITELEQRERALASRESAVRCGDYLKEINIAENYRTDFLEVLDTTDFDKFKAIVDRLGKPYITTIEIEGAPTYSPLVFNNRNDDFEIAKAFAPKQKG